MKAVGQTDNQETSCRAREAAGQAARRPLCHHQKQPGQPLPDPAQRRRGEMGTAEDGGKD